jgi:hypothetical protein
MRLLPAAFTERETGRTVQDGDDDIGVDSDGFDEELEDQEQKPKLKTPLRHTSGYAKP